MSDSDLSKIDYVSAYYTFKDAELCATTWKLPLEEIEKAHFEKYQLRQKLERCLANKCYGPYTYTKVFLRLAQLDQLDEMNLDRYKDIPPCYGNTDPARWIMYREGSLDRWSHIYHYKNNPDQLSARAMDKVYMALSEFDAFRYDTIEFKSIKPYIDGYLDNYYRPLTLSVFTEYNPSAITVLTSIHDVGVDTAQKDILIDPQRRKLTLKSNYGFGAKLGAHILSRDVDGLSHFRLAVGVGISYFSSEITEDSRLKTLSGETIGETFFDTYSTLRIPMHIKFQFVASPRWSLGIGGSFPLAFFAVSYQKIPEDKTLPERHKSLTGSWTLGLEFSLEHHFKNKRHSLFADIGFLYAREDPIWETPVNIGLDDLEVRSYMISPARLLIKVGYSFRFSKTKFRINKDLFSENLVKQTIDQIDANSSKKD